MQARHGALHPCAVLRGSGGRGRPHSPHGADATAGLTVPLTPQHQTRGMGTGRKTQMPRGCSSRRLGAPPPAPPPAPGDGTAPSCKAHHGWSSGTAPRCRSCGGPGPEGLGQRALPRCKAVPSRRPGDRGEDEPQGLSSWLAQEALERGAAVSPTTGDSGRRPAAGRQGAIFKWSMRITESSRKPTHIS